MNLVTIPALLLLLWLLPTALPAQCASPANIYSFVFNNKTYEVVKENRNWGDAAACAVQRGGRLAEIDSPSEQSAIYTQLAVNAGININLTRPLDGGGAGYVWLGGTDRATEGTWIWDGANSGSGPQFWQGLSAAKGGSNVNGLYTNWGNEPDDYGRAGQDALAIALSAWPLGMAGQWNDLNETDELYYLIEHSGIVPVELHSFNAEQVTGGVRLYWRTATETNNIGWTVERRDESSGWQGLAFVPGAGTTTEERSYTWIDLDPGSAPVIEYRLRQQDADGRVEYSHPAAVPSAGAAISPVLYQNHPNPFRTITTISFVIAGDRDATLLVTDATGRILQRHSFAAGLSSGLRTITFDGAQFPPGMYFCRLQTGRLIHTRAMLLLK